ncbi:MAG: glycosyltransferase [Candidatus Latescibacteria bacterium]|nr:glycosyltransferase [Candidatus Latescibacterota bacterium]
MGGSQGAHVINEALRTDLQRMLERAHVVHISGRIDYQSLLATHELLPEAMRTAYRLHDFIDDGFADLLAAADIVVSRAGATSVAELSAVGTAAVLIPGTFGASHQVKTAEAMVAAGAAVVLREQDLSPNKMANAVLGLLDDPDRLTEMGSASQTRGQPKAAQNIAQIGLRLAHCSTEQVGAK